jgi:hypothetical protein
MPQPMEPNHPVRPGTSPLPKSFLGGGYGVLDKQIRLPA